MLARRLLIPTIVFLVLGHTMNAAVLDRLAGWYIGHMIDLDDQWQTLAPSEASPFVRDAYDWGSMRAVFPGRLKARWLTYEYIDAHDPTAAKFSAHSVRLGAPWPSVRGEESGSIPSGYLRSNPLRS